MGFCGILWLVAVLLHAGQARNYTVEVVAVDPHPVLSYLNGTSTYFQVFNPSWIAATKTQPNTGLIVRAQNCSAKPGKCISCSGMSSPSVLVFAEQISPEPNPTFSRVSKTSIAFAPSEIAEAYGTEDPRVALLPNGTYLMFYTQYGHDKNGNTQIRLGLASTTNPTKNESWVRHGPILSGKSGALLVRENPPHYLYWGDSEITVATSNDLLNWTNQHVFIAPRKDSFDSGLCESGPPPMILSTGDYIFFHNSANNTGYHPEWAIIDGANPLKLLQRASTPLLSPPMFPWAVGTAPELCNVPNVIFLEAAHPTDKPDVFRVYFGGSDTVIGTALIKVTANSE